VRNVLGIILDKHVSSKPNIAIKNTATVGAEETIGTLCVNYHTSIVYFKLS
jgi:hypothetical protein